MSQAHALYQLQLTDSECLRTGRALEEAEAGLGETREVRQARQMLAQEEDAFGKWSVRMRDLDLELKGLGEKIERSEQRLYGGGVRNPKELGSLQADLEHLRRRRDRAEDQLLEAMTEVDEREARVTEARALLDQVESQWNVEQAGRRSTVARLKEDLVSLRGRRDELRSSISTPDLALYDRLLRSKGGLAVAVLKGQLCGGCRVRVPSSLAQRVRQGAELVICNNCGRIIVKE